jgi:hypothetical protein
VRTVTVYFTLQRQSKSYILKYFCPLAFLVFLSTLSYFIDPKSVPRSLCPVVLPSSVSTVTARSRKAFVDEFTA